MDEIKNLSQDNSKSKYEELIKSYKEEIKKYSDSPRKAINARNLLAFAYFKANRIEEARQELLSLINDFQNYTAYRQLINIEKSEGNLDDAILWAYQGLEKYPDSNDFIKQLILMSKEDKDSQEFIYSILELLKNEKER